MAEEIVNRHIILGLVYEKIHEKYTQINLKKIRLHSLFSWSKVGMGPQYHEAITVGD